VFIAGIDELSVYDRVVDGRPTHPERLRTAYTAYLQGYGNRDATNP
jgi:hypothetical protein